MENASESKSSDFVVTPPLFVMKPQKENTLRIMYVGPNNLPADRESLYWVNVKAIPSAAKDTKGKNTLQIAVLSRIKLLSARKICRWPRLMRRRSCAFMKAAIP